MDTLHYCKPFCFFTFHFQLHQRWQGCWNLHVTKCQEKWNDTNEFFLLRLLINAEYVFSFPAKGDKWRRMPRIKCERTWKMLGVLFFWQWPRQLDFTGTLRRKSLSAYSFFSSPFIFLHILFIVLFFQLWRRRVPLVNCQELCNVLESQHKSHKPISQYSCKYVTQMCKVWKTESGAAGLVRLGKIRD